MVIGPPGGERHDVGEERVLIVAAHPDDEVLMCGGLIAKCRARGARVLTIFLADGESGRGVNLVRSHARATAARDVAQSLGMQAPMFLDFPDQRLDAVPLLELTQAIEAASGPFLPTMVITHNRSDLNLDHRTTFEAAATAFRPLPGRSCRRFLCGEVPSTTDLGALFGHGAFAPCLFVDVEAVWTGKIGALLQYGTETPSPPHPRSIRSIEALARTRGATCGLAAAEAFEVMYEIEG